MVVNPATSDIMESVAATGNEITIKLKRFCAVSFYWRVFRYVCRLPKAYEIGSGKLKPNEFVGTGPTNYPVFSELVKMDVFDQYWGENPLIGN